jgi:deoxyribose-phosphate aldolase
MIKKFNTFINERFDKPTIDKTRPTVDINKRFNRIIDFTYLKEDANVEKIKEICDIAKQEQFYSVCIRPQFVSEAKKFLENSNIKICTVVSFPKGDASTKEKLDETQKAISEGADEIDMVMNYNILLKWTSESKPEKKKSLEENIFTDIRKVCEMCHGSNSITLKVIIESGVLTFDQVKKACEICVKAGVDFVKTSTGYAQKGAEIDKVKYMREILPDHIKIKASGGIRTMTDIDNFVKAGADRIGTSSNPALLTVKTSENY